MTSLLLAVVLEPGQFPQTEEQCRLQSLDQFQLSVQQEKHKGYKHRA